MERLSRDDVGKYIEHRIAVAGGRRTIFPGSVMERVWRRTGGTPRLINLLCDRALLGAYVQGKHAIDWATLDAAALEVFGKPSGVSRYWRSALGIAAALAVGGGLAAAYLWAPTPDRNGKEAPGASAASIAAAPSSAAVTHSSAQGQDEAVRRLGQLWGESIPVEERGSACDILERRGLRCMYGVAGIEMLQQMNVPAVLRLSAPAEYGATHVVLVSAQRGLARLALGGDRESDMPLSALSATMSGDYIVLWRGPIAGAARVLKPGVSGQEVAWLARSLAALDGQAPPPPETMPQFEGSLQQRVRSFQQRQGLPSDGVAGAATMVRLALALDPNAPTLALEGSR